MSGIPEESSVVQSASERRDQRRRINAGDSATEATGPATGRNARSRLDSTPTRNSQGSSLAPEASFAPNMQPLSADQTALSPTKSPRASLNSPIGTASNTPLRRGLRSRARSAVRASHDSGSERSSRHHRGSREAFPVMPPQPQGKAEVHIIGEIMGASAFEQAAVYCRWQLLYEPTKTWALLRGLDKGATHVCSATLPEDDFVAWEHPLDVQLMTQTVQGWPSLVFMVYARDDSSGKDRFVSYGICALPKAPGVHHLQCQTWCVVETQRVQQRRLFAWFTGLTPRLEDESFVLDADKRDKAGPAVCSIGAGLIHLRVQVLIKDPQHLHYLSGESLFHALEKVRYALEKRNHKDVARISQIRLEDEEQEVQEQLTEGQRRMREGREARLASARHSVDGRRTSGSRDASFTGSVTDRARSADPIQRRPSGLQRPSRSAPRRQPTGGEDGPTASDDLRTPSSTRQLSATAAAAAAPANVSGDAAGGATRSGPAQGAASAGTAAAAGRPAGRASGNGGESGQSASEDDGLRTRTEEEIAKRRAQREARRKAALAGK